ncbi:MAG: gamma-glutamyl-gamma-aminobutyrate hydrolase family protein [Candidatus Moraniibacteriota bacterium]|nr:MAG: gamma-glutamyl-gamma-aminobutyrate hydrolase family protein [Candidatus Moranbacteria bacterium]
MSLESRLTFSSRERSETMDEAEAGVIRYLSRIQEAQREFDDIVAGKTVLLVDSGQGVPQHAFARRVENLRGMGFEALSKMVIEKIFGGKVPASALESFQQFLGHGVRIVHRDVADTTSLPSDISAVVFSGSPADVSKAFSDPSRSIHRDSRLTHGQVFQFVRRVYEGAAEKNIPIIGFCYGHQAMAALEGGKVSPLKEPRQRFQKMELLDDSREFLGGVFVDRPPLSIHGGELPVNHSEAVTPNPQRSMLLMHTTERDSLVAEGLLHLSGLENKYSGTPQERAALLQSLLEDDKGAAKLGIQAHPEIAGFYPMMNFSLGADPSVFRRSAENDISPEMLRLIARFLQLHKKFRA